MSGTGHPTLVATEAGGGPRGGRRGLLAGGEAGRGAHAARLSAGGRRPRPASASSRSCWAVTGSPSAWRPAPSCSTTSSRWTAATATALAAAGRRRDRRRRGPAGLRGRLAGAAGGLQRALAGRGARGGPVPDPHRSHRLRGQRHRGHGDLLLAGEATAADFGLRWASWWAADTNGTLLLTPLLMVWLSPAGGHQRAPPVGDRAGGAGGGAGGRAGHPREPRRGEPPRDRAAPARGRGDRGAGAGRGPLSAGGAVDRRLRPRRGPRRSPRLRAVRQGRAGRSGHPRAGLGAAAVRRRARRPRAATAARRVAPTTRCRRPTRAASCNGPAIAPSTTRWI